MKVFKFGGASVSSIDRIKSLPSILEAYSSENITIIISAMGKTTNGLEKVASAFFAGDKDTALQLFNVIKQQHTTTSKYLLVTRFNDCMQHLGEFFTEIEWLLHDKPVRTFDYYYDQIVCIGELLSTTIIHYYLLETGIANEWLDVRDLLRTDNNFRDAIIDWKESTEKIQSKLDYASSKPTIYLTQGFIGATDENESTTLGREGSDYTAAIFANILNADSLTIWKDVEGVMSADPKAFPDATLIHTLSYEEVIEMAYYGAQVIHPKTIKPLQNKGIPLLVKCFLDTTLPGTTIQSKTVKNLPPIIVIKSQQVLLHLHSQDFSFVGDAPMAALYGWLGELKLKPNLIQTGAISVQLCLDDAPEKIDALAAAASSVFDVQVEKGLQLLTIRHYTPERLQTMTAGKDILLLQQSKTTVQALYR